jgi:hypothetical protein
MGVTPQDGGDVGYREFLDALYEADVAVLLQAAINTATAPSN